MTNAETAERTALPKPTVTRLIYTLVELGYLIEARRNGKFRPGPAVLAALAQEKFALLDPSTELRSFRQDGYDQLPARGFTIAPQATRYAETVTSVSVPHFYESFGTVVGLSCGASPTMLTQQRMVDEVGPALHCLVRGLEKRTGQLPALSNRD